MSDVAIYNTTNNRVIDYKKFVNTPDYDGRTDVVINPNVVNLLIQNIPIKYWKYEAGSIVEMTQVEKDAVDLELSQANTIQNRTVGKALIAALDGNGIILRALADIIKDELNSIRGWLVSFKAEVNSATSLADLKTRVATLPNMPDRTLDQLKTAITNRIDTGNVDS